MGAPLFLLCDLGVLRGAYIVSAQCPKKFGDEPINMALLRSLPLFRVLCFIDIWQVFIIWLLRNRKENVVSTPMNLYN
jgi:hypothetical protein